MSRARDLGNLASSATVLATDSEVSAAVAAIDLTNVQRIVPVDSNISVPGAPTSVSAGIDDGQSAVSFVAPTDNGGSTILSYTVISSPGNIKKSGSSSPITVTGLTNGTAYTFTVKAHNIAGSSVASTASNSVTPLPAVIVNYLVVAGGGSGGSIAGSDLTSGGGGAGGLRSSVTATGGGGTLGTALTLDVSTNYTVTVGAGGATTSWANRGNNGSNSVFHTITSTGGGGGGYYGNPGNSGNSGGCGGGGAHVSASGGAGTANQGYAGGNGSSTNANGSSGGGGGAGVAGGNGFNGANDEGGSGGNGVAVSITGSSVTYAGGGGGGTNGTVSSNNQGGTGGGGAGATRNNNGVAGTANTGGGGGGGSHWANTPPSGRPQAAGGSGVVILRYPASKTITIGAGLTGSTATDGSFKVTSLTAGTGNVSWA